ncbi:hypothetical protein BBP40_007696 [Aspergillus hancockii]|nr:hypothetical protein BBP40_007696 [Aspergillus hancockii]
MRIIGLSFLFPLLATLLCDVLPAEGHYHHRHHYHHIRQANGSMVNKHMWSKRALVENQCKGSHPGLITQGLSDAATASTRIIKRTKELENFIAQNTDDLPDDEVLVSTLRTF